MALLHALGLGVAIIVLRVLAPEIWSATEQLTILLLTAVGDTVHHLQAASAVLSLPLAR